MIHKVRHLVTVTSRREHGRRIDHGSEQSQAAEGREAPEEARRPRPGLGQRQDGRARPQGREVALGLQVQARVRRRPDAAAPARAEARVPQPVPRRVRGGEPRHARPSGSRPARSSRRSCCASAAWSAARGSRSRCWRAASIGKALTVRAHKFSGKAAEKIAAAGGAAEARSREGANACRGVGYGKQPEEHLRRLRPAQPRAVHAGAARRVPPRQPHPDAGREPGGAGRAGAAGCRTRCSASTTCSRAATCRR